MRSIGLCHKGLLRKYLLHDILNLPRTSLPLPIDAMCRPPEFLFRWRGLPIEAVANLLLDAVGQTGKRGFKRSSCPSRGSKNSLPAATYRSDTRSPWQTRSRSRKSKRTFER
jgi:hypothetical protein